MLTAHLEALLTWANLFYIMGDSARAAWCIERMKELVSDG